MYRSTKAEFCAGSSTSSSAAAGLPTFDVRRPTLSISSRMTTGFLTPASSRPWTIRPGPGARKLGGSPRTCASSQTPPSGTLTHGRPSASPITFASDVLPQPGGPAKQRMGDGAAGRGCRTTMAAGPPKPPPVLSAPRHASTVHAVPCNVRTARKRRMRSLTRRQPA